jgi:hypothetical protein
VRRLFELLEAPCRLASPLAPGLGRCELILISAISRSFFTNPQTKCTPFALAPGHQLIAREAAVGTQ